MTKRLLTGIATIGLLITAIGCSSQNPVSDSLAAGDNNGTVNIAPQNYAKTAVVIGNFINFDSIPIGSSHPKWVVNNTHYPWTAQNYWNPLENRYTVHYRGNNNVITRWSDRVKTENCHVQISVRPTSYDKPTAAALACLSTDCQNYYMAVMEDKYIKIAKCSNGTITQLGRARCNYQVGKYYYLTITREPGNRITGTVFTTSIDVLGQVAMFDTRGGLVLTGRPGLKTPNSSDNVYVDWVAYVPLD